MLAGRKLIVDCFSEVHAMLCDWRDADFWDFENLVIEANSIYVISRKSFVEYPDKIRSMLAIDSVTVVFDNAAEGSWTLVSQLQMLKFDDMARAKRLLVIGGGDMPHDYSYVQYDHFLDRILDYAENIAAMQRIDEIFDKPSKPYKFLFLNGRARPHRKYLYERLRNLNLLQHSLWSMLDTRPCLSRSLKLHDGSVNLMATASQLQRLDLQYEVHRYRDNTINPGPPNRTFVKSELFANEWGEIYLNPDCYIDTYFSLVTETVFDYAHSFRTEKIAKPLAQGHPWIAVANPGFYRDLRNLGFKTFDHVIDESFDSIQHHQTRLERVIAVVQDLCSQDLAAFMQSCQAVCKYNQQHLQDLVPRLRQQFPEKFSDLIQQHARS